MTNKLLLLGVFITLVLGCGISDRLKKAVSGSEENSASNVNANKTLTDKAVDTAVGEKKIGIAECDEAMDILAAQANDPDDNFVTKAAKKTLLNTFREQLKQSLEDNKTDKKGVAKFCREFKENLEDSLKEEDENSN